jgi:Ran GTPase-activating protein (RanGAP) involved in mRNA processing and transport
MASLDILIREIAIPPLPLETLDLSKSNISTRYIQRILSNHRRNLTSLNLAHNAFEHDVIFDISLADKLTELDLSDNIISSTELNALCFLTKLKTLKLNNLTYIQPGSSLAITFANITRHLNDLTRLEIRNNVLPIEFSINFIRALSSKNTLTELDLSEAGIDPEEIFELSDITSLEHLSLSHNQMSSDIIDLLGESFSENPNFKSLIMANTLEQCEPLIPLTKIKSLTELDLSHNTLIDPQLQDLLPIKSKTNLPNIIKLKLHHNYLTNDSALFISSWLLSNKTLQELDLSNNLLTYQSAEAIAKALESNATLKSLELSTNGLSKIGISIISKALSKKSALTKLNVSNNQIEHIGLRELILKLKDSNITELDISQNNCEPRLATLLADQLEFEYLDLRKLNIANSKIQVAGADALIKASKLTDLDISNSHISSFDLNKLCKTIKAESALTTLKLRGCFSHINSLRPLHHELTRKRSLTSLDLRDNRLLTSPLFINSLVQQNDNLTEVLFNEPQAAKPYTGLYLTVNRQSRLKEGYNKYSRLFILQTILLLNTTHQAANPQNHLIKVPKLLIFQIIDFLKPKYRSHQSLMLCLDRVDRNLANRKKGVTPWWESILIKDQKLNKIFERAITPQV